MLVEWKNEQVPPMFLNPPLLFLPSLILGRLCKGLLRGFACTADSPCLPTLCFLALLAAWPTSWPVSCPWRTTRGQRVTNLTLVCIFFFPGHCGQEWGWGGGVSDGSQTPCSGCCGVLPRSLFRIMVLIVPATECWLLMVHSWMFPCDWRKLSYQMQCPFPGITCHQWLVNVRVQRPAPLASNWNNSESSSQLLRSYRISWSLFCCNCNAFQLFPCPVLLLSLPLKVFPNKPPVHKFSSQSLCPA